MLNPGDIISLETGEGLENLDPNFLAEFENGKEEGEDDE